MDSDSFVEHYAADRHRVGEGFPAWVTPLAVMVVTLLFAHLLFIRPARHEMARLHRQVGALQESVNQLAGHGKTAAATNRLLGQLAQQASRTTDAAAALTAIQTLHTRLHDEATLLSQAQEALASLARLRDEVQQNTALIQEARQALLALHELQENLVSGLDSTAQARAISYDLLALNKQLVDEGQQVSTAQSALEQLVEIRTELDQQGGQIGLADQRAEALIALKNKVLATTDDLASSIETFERALDLQHQFTEASESFQEIRQLLAEMVMLRSGTAQIVEHLKPLTDLVNLRRLTAVEIRQMARTVIDQRREQIAASQGAQDLPSSGTGSGTGSVVSKAELTSARSDER